MKKIYFRFETIQRSHVDIAIRGTLKDLDFFAAVARSCGLVQQTRRLSLTRRNRRTSTEGSVALSEM